MFFVVVGFFSFAKAHWHCSAMVSAREIPEQVSGMLISDIN